MAVWSTWEAFSNFLSGTPTVACAQVDRKMSLAGFLKGCVNLVAIVGLSFVYFYPEWVTPYLPKRTIVSNIEGISFENLIRFGLTAFSYLLVLKNSSRYFVIFALIALQTYLWHLFLSDQTFLDEIEDEKDLYCWLLTGLFFTFGILALFAGDQVEDEKEKLRSKQD